MNPSRKWPGLLAGLLVVAVFFEGAGFSFRVMGFRVRSVQVLEIVFFGFLGVLWLLGRWRWQRSPLDYWLLAYLAINFIAIFNSAWKTRSVKIFLLLVSLALLYWLVYQLLGNAKDFLLAFYVFLAMGTLQVVFGLYQVLAGALNYYRGWVLPIGHMGMVHQKYINSVWGRPYGTQVEPDFYGAISMVFALIFIILYFSKKVISKKWLLAGTLLSLLGLYFSFVRVSWIVFFLVLTALAVCGKTFSFYNFTWKAAVLIVVVAVGLHAVVVNIFPPILQIVQTRFASEPGDLRKGTVLEDKGSLLSDQNVRLILIRLSLQSWRENPIVGNGPGSFPYAYWRATMGEAVVRRKISEKSFRQTNPSILFTVLEDSGLAGLFLFLAMAVKFIFLCRAKLAGPSTPLAAPAFALAAGLAALFLSYVLTNGLWLPLTWVFLALAVASLRQFPSEGGDENAGKRGA